MLIHNQIFSNYIYKRLNINHRRLNYIIGYYLFTKYVIKLSIKKFNIAYNKNTPPK